MKRSTSERSADTASVLSTVCEFIADCEHKTAPTQSSGYPSIRTPNIGRGRLLLEGVNRVSEKTYMAWTRRGEPKEGDLILAREAPVGNVAIITPGLKVCLGQRTVLIRPDRSKINPAYLLYLLLGREVQTRIQSMTQGATVPHLNLGDIRALPLPAIPERLTQDRIAEVLSAYDDLIENNTRRIKILEEMARSLYREWFVDFRFPGHETAKMVASPLGAVPTGWKVGSLSDILVPRNANAKSGPELKPRPYLPIECLPQRSLAIASSENWESAQSSLHLFERDDVLFGAMRPYFHKVALAPFAGVTRKTVFVLRPATPTHRAFALLTAFRDETVAYANAHSRGATIPYAVWEGALAAMKIVVPPSAVLAEFEVTVGPMIDWLSGSFARQRTLRATRDLLLPRLISGEIELAP